MQRVARYAEAADRLLAEDKAYHCYCSPAELEAERKRRRRRTSRRATTAAAPSDAAERAALEAEGRKPVVRFRIPRTA
jgi:nondiscriminating glutamyl-tRNA synthetase